MNKHTNFQSFPAMSEQDTIRIVNNDGSRSYYHPHTSEGKTPVNVYSTNFREFFDMLSNRFEILIRMLNNSDYSDFGFLAQSLLQYSKIQINEIAHYLEQEHEFQIDLVSHVEPFDRPDRIVGVSISKKSEE